jgi:hypothetical protein
LYAVGGSRHGFGRHRLDSGTGGFFHTSTSPRRLVGKHGPDRLEIFFGVVLGTDVQFFDRVTDHDQAAARAEAQGRE